MDFFFAVHVTKALGAEADDVKSLRGLIDHVANGFVNLRIAKSLDHVVWPAKQEMQ